MKFETLNFLKLWKNLKVWAFPIFVGESISTQNCIGQEQKVSPSDPFLGYSCNIGGHITCKWNR